MAKQKVVKVGRVLASAKRSKEVILSYDVRHVAYTGSPDSEAVAGYVKHFTYDPRRTEEVRKKYAAILKSE